MPLAAASQHVFSAEQYVKLDISERTELLGGLIYDVSPRNEPHRHAVASLNRALTTALADSAYEVRVQDAVAVPGWRGNDAPEVDVAIVRRARYELGPTAADAFAFIEVSDTTYADDRAYKVPLYVRAGVPAWIGNVALRQVERYGSAADLEKPHGTVFGIGDSFDVLGVRVAVSDLF